MAEAQGRKEVAEAVLQAAIIAICTGLINWGIEQAKKHAEKRDQGELKGPTT